MDGDNGRLTDGRYYLHLGVDHPGRWMRGSSPLYQLPYDRLYATMIPLDCSNGRLMDSRHTHLGVGQRPLDEGVIALVQLTLGHPEAREGRAGGVTHIVHRHHGT
jgi:hypothetical protein